MYVYNVIYLYIYTQTKKCGTPEKRIPAKHQPQLGGAIACTGMAEVWAIAWALSDVASSEFFSSGEI